MSKLNADILQDMFVKEANKEKSRKEIAEFHGISLGSLNNYFAAKKAYDSGNLVNAQNVSKQLFIDWARKYGEHGDPCFKTEAPGRSHRKKVEQQTIDLDGLKVEPSENKELPLEYFFADKIASILRTACERGLSIDINFSADSKKLLIEGDVMAWASLF